MALRHPIPSIRPRKLLPALLFVLLADTAPPTARAVDSRTERAREIREQILQKRREQGLVPEARENPFDAAVAAARERVAAIDAQIEERRRRSESLAAPRDKLAVREEELAAAVAKLQEENRARVEAVYRSAKLGAGAAGWHAEPARSARLSRYLAAIASVQQARLDVVEVEHGSVIAALDRARAEDAAAAAELRVLETERVEADSHLAHALSQRGTPGGVDAAPEFAEGDADLADLGAAIAAGSDDDAPADDPADDPALAVERAMAALAARSAPQPPAAEPGPVDDGNGAATGDTGAFEWPGTQSAPGARGDGAAPNASAAPDIASAKPVEPSADPYEHAELEDGPAVLAPSSATAAASARPAGSDGAGASPAGGDSPAAEAQAAPPGDAPATNPPVRRGFISRIFGNDRDADAFAAARGELPPPVAGKVVANYGQQHKSGATYRGVILRAGHSEPIRSVADGKVSFAGMVPGLGNTVIVNHGGRYHTVYARLGTIGVKEGESVHGGTEIGGLPEDSADLHFELRDQGKAIDPLPWLRGVPGAAP